VKLAVGILLAALSAGCNRHAPSASLVADAAGPPQLTVRVPAALTLARALHTLTIEVDPASLAATQVAVDPGMFLGVEREVTVFAQGQVRPAPSRFGFSWGTDFDLGTDTWTTAQDRIPEPGVKYVAEMQLVLFETDVPPGDLHDPHAGKYKVLWTRTLQQAEE